MKVRIVDDTADMATLLRVNLNVTRPHVEVEVVTDGLPRMLDPANWDGIDIAVIDVMMPGVSGDQILFMLATHRPEIRRVVWTASMIAHSDNLAALADRVIQKGELTMSELDHAIFGD